MDDIASPSYKIGRNDLCTCGSGRKYKVCCLKPANIIDFAWRNLRRLEGQVIDEYLGPYVSHKLPESIMATAMHDLFPEDLPEEMDKELLFTNLFIPWLLFNWIPNDDFGIKDFLPNEPIAMQYIKKYPCHLNSEQKNFVEHICKTYYSFFVVLDVVVNQSLLVKDILLGKEFLVKEKLGTQSLNKGDIILSRILTLNDQSIFIGMSPYHIHAQHHAELIKFRENLIKESKIESLTPQLLKEKFAYDIFDCYFAIVEENFRKPLPELRNTDGDPIQLCKSFFTLEISAEAVLKKLLPLTLYKDVKSFHAEAKRDNAGMITQLEFPWLTKGNQAHPNWDNTLLGYIKINNNKLVLETNSEKRANKGHKLLKKYLKEEIHFQKTLIESSAHLLKELVEKKSKNITPNANNKIEEMKDSPEIQEMLKTMIQKHWENWFDQPIPMLDNKTPIEATKTKEGREQLEALLLLYERNDMEQKNNLMRVDIAYLKSKLGLMDSHKENGGSNNN